MEWMLTVATVYLVVGVGVAYVTMHTGPLRLRIDRGSFLLWVSIWPLALLARQAAKNAAQQLGGQSFDSAEAPGPAGASSAQTRPAPKSTVVDFYGYSYSVARFASKLGGSEELAQIHIDGLRKCMEAGIRAEECAVALARSQEVLQEDRSEVRNMMDAWENEGLLRAVHLKRASHLLRKPR